MAAPSEQTAAVGDADRAKDANDPPSGKEPPAELVTEPGEEKKDDEHESDTANMVKGGNPTVSTPVSKRTRSSAGTVNIFQVAPKPPMLHEESSSQNDNRTAAQEERSGDKAQEETEVADDREAVKGEAGSSQQARHAEGAVRGEAEGQAIESSGVEASGNEDGANIIHLNEEQGNPGDSALGGEYQPQAQARVQDAEAQKTNDGDGTKSENAAPSKESRADTRSQFLPPNPPVPPAHPVMPHGTPGHGAPPGHDHQSFYPPYPPYYPPPPGAGGYPPYLPPPGYPYYPPPPGAGGYPPPPGAGGYSPYPPFPPHHYAPHHSYFMPPPPGLPPGGDGQYPLNYPPPPGAHQPPPATAPPPLPPSAAVPPPAASLSPPRAKADITKPAAEEANNHPSPTPPGGLPQAYASYPPASPLVSPNASLPASFDYTGYPSPGYHHHYGRMHDQYPDPYSHLTPPPHYPLPGAAHGFNNEKKGAKGGNVAKDDAGANTKDRVASSGEKDSTGGFSYDFSDEFKSPDSISENISEDMNHEMEEMANPNLISASSAVPVTARIKVYVKSKGANVSKDVLERRSRKNEQSRARAAKHRDMVNQIEKKPESERTPEETKIWMQFQHRRQRKNDRSRTRAKERKEEIDRILAIPEEQRTKIEVNFLETALGAKKRKNMGDRERRTRQKHQSGAKKAEAKESVGGPAPLATLAPTPNGYPGVNAHAGYPMPHTMMLPSTGYPGHHPHDISPHAPHHYHPHHGPPGMPPPIHPTQHEMQHFAPPTNHISDEPPSPGPVF